MSLIQYISSKTGIMLQLNSFYTRIIGRYDVRVDAMTNSFAIDTCTNTNCIVVLVRGLFENMLPKRVCKRA